MTTIAGPVWVFVEQIDGHELDVSLQLIGRARKLAGELGTKVEAILLGEGLAGPANRLFSAGADRVYLGDDPRLRVYDSSVYTEMIVDLARERQPEILLLGSTATGRELAPLVAARLGTGLTTHCIDLVLNEDKILEQKVPAYGGLISIICPIRRPQMATAALGVFPTPPLDPTRSGEIVPIHIPPGFAPRVQTLEIVREAPAGVSLESAAVIVAGGAGAGDAAGWRVIAELAQVLNAALGSSRPAVDEGWTELATMIGQSGKMVHPQVYIGAGISGELQHMVGLVDAQMLIGINKDSSAPIFSQVDYGIVDDCREFIPLLIREIRARQSA